MLRCGHVSRCLAGFTFGLHSPILGFLTTFGMFAINAVNLWLGYQEPDKRYALLLTPLMVWLTLSIERFQAGNCFTRPMNFLQLHLF
jgi:hypothetical protein